MLCLRRALFGSGSQRLDLRQAAREIVRARVECGACLVEGLAGLVEIGFHLLHPTVVHGQGDTDRLGVPGAERGRITDEALTFEEGVVLHVPALVTLALKIASPSLDEDLALAVSL